jgi:cytochrome c553
MRKLIVLAAVVAAIAPFSHAANIEAGKAKVAQVCAACHGPDGTSVSETIPNLAGQRARYIEDQLKALREGTRKNSIMSAIARQLSADDIANVAAYFASQSGAPSGARSEFMPTIAKTNVTFPENRQGFVRYHAANFPDAKQVKVYYANEVALRAAKNGTRLPDGALIVSEISTVKLDDKLELAKDAKGIFIPNALVSTAVMARGERWGKELPDMLRNEDWNYAVFSADKRPRAGINHAECLACHKPQDDVNFLFTMKELTDAARR